MARYSAPPYSLKTVRTTQPQTPVRFSEEGNAIGAFAYIGGTNFVVGDGKTIGFYDTLTILNVEGLPNGTNSTKIGNFGAVGISPVPLMLQVSGKMTFILQWKHGDIGSTTNIFGAGDNSGGYVEQFGISQDAAGTYTTGRVRFSLRDPSGNVTSISPNTTDITFVNNTVYTIVIVYKGNNQIEVWVNGKQISYTTSGTAFNNTTVGPMTQATHYSIGNMFYGLVDIYGNTNARISVFARIPKQLDGKAVSINPWRIFSTDNDTNILPNKTYVSVRESKLLPTSGPTKSVIAPFILRAPKVGFGDRFTKLGKPVPEVLAAAHTGNGLVEMVSGIRMSAASSLVNRAKGPVFIAAASPTPRMRLANNRTDFTAFGIAVIYGSDSSGAFIYMLDPGTGYGWRGGLYAASGTPSIGIGGYWNGAITTTIIGAYGSNEHARPVHWAIAYSATNATMSAFINGRHVGTNTSVVALDPAAGPNPGFNPYDNYSVNNGLSTAGVIAGSNFEKAKYISSNVYAMFNPAKSCDLWASI